MSTLNFVIDGDVYTNGIKTSIKQEPRFLRRDNGSVSLLYFDKWGDQVYEVYTVPKSGGYIRNSQGERVNQRLRLLSGDPLKSTRKNLLETIQREFKMLQNSLNGRL